MKRLDFVLPDFTRLSWTGDRARHVWEARISRISQAWSDIEWLSVLAGIRACGLKIASPEEFVAQAGEWAKQGLSGLPLAIQGLSPHSYSSTSIQPEAGKPIVFRIVIGSPANITSFKKAWDNNDDEQIGQLLGYPTCCHHFYHRVWVDEGLIDTTWPMARGATSLNGEQQLEVTGPPEANILWRWMGVRAVSHLPCRFDCQPTVELGQKLIDVGRSNGYGQEMDWLLEILSWPVEWSALHGIAEIKTPILKVSARTDATPIKYVVRRKGAAYEARLHTSRMTPSRPHAEHENKVGVIGESYPAEGAQGLDFPYRAPTKALLTGTTGFRRGLDNPIEKIDISPPSSPPKEEDEKPPLPPEEAQGEGDLPTSPPWYASDNGFNSRRAMEQAHRPIVELAVTTLSDQVGNVLDLGCGNGALLQKILQANPNITPFGLEIEAGRLEHARLLNPKYAGNFSQGNMFDSDLPWPDQRRYALAILMPGRLLEAQPEQASRLKEQIKRHCDRLLLYAYGDWLTRYGNLQGLAKEVGLLLLNTNQHDIVSLVDIELLPPTKFQRRDL